MAVGLNLRAIREAIKAQLDAAGFDRSVTVYAYHPGSLTFPCIIVRPASDYVGYFTTFGENGLADVQFEIEIQTTGRVIDAQMALDDWLSVGSGATSSLVDALMADVTLGGAVQTCRLLSAGGYPDVELSDGPLSVRLPLEVTINKIGANA